MHHLEPRRRRHVAGTPRADRSPRPEAQAARGGRGGLAVRLPPRGGGWGRGGAGAGRRERRRRRACRGCQTWLKRRRCRYCCSWENAEPSRARWAAAARAATGTRFSGAAAVVMARLADYFIVVGYDHEKPGKGVGWAPPPGLPAPAPRPGPLSRGLRRAGRRGGEARRPPRAASELGVGVRPSGPGRASRWACGTGTRGGGGGGGGEEAAPAPAGGSAGPAGPSPGAGSLALSGLSAEGSAAARAGLGRPPGPGGRQPTVLGSSGVNFCPAS